VTCAHLDACGSRWSHATDTAAGEIADSADIRSWAVMLEWYCRQQDANPSA
jgi:hypothetical protein